MSFQVFSATKDAPIWDAMIQRLPYDYRDVHLSSAWGRAHETPTASAWLAVLETAGTMVCQPLLLRHVAGAFCDLTWPGYGGPMTDSTMPAITDGVAMDRALQDWRDAHNVVSEFYLVNPIYAAAQHILIPRHATMVVEQGVTVLPTELHDVLKMMRPNRRESLRKGERAVVEFIDSREEAQAIYDQAMERLGAPARWRIALPWEPRGFTFAAKADGVTKAIAMFLVGTEAAYYHLAARTDDCPTGFSDQLILAGVNMAHEYGVRWLHLGGGRTGDDGLAAYKRSWGGMIRPAYSVRRVHDPDAYDIFDGRSGLRDHHGVDADFFPSYRRKENQ